MREHRISASGPAPWAGAGRVNEDTTAPAGGQAGDCAAAVTGIASLVGDTRRLVLVAGGLLVADIAATPVVVSALLGRGHNVAWGSSALLIPVTGSWLAAAALLVLAQQPVAIALGELRRATGAPTDPSAPWRPLGVRPLADADLGRGHAAPLIGAAAIAHTRARLALAWAVAATTGFLLWTAISLAIAAVS